MALALAQASVLDDGPLTSLRGGSWCCLLCKRQFESEEKLGKHLGKSALHAENRTAALASGRLREPAGAAKRN